MMAKFERHGISIEDQDLLSSAQAAAALVKRGTTATVLGGQGINEALELAGVEVVDLDLLGDQGVGAVFVGLDRHLTFDRLSSACRAISAGAAFIATNDDATYPTPEGVLPGGGAFVAAVTYATRQQAVVAGKPYPPAVALAKSVLGTVAVVVGDRPETDGALAQGLGARYAMVRSGVTPAGETVVPTPDYDAADLAEIVGTYLGLTRDQILAAIDLHSTDG